MISLDRRAASRELAQRVMSHMDSADRNADIAYTSASTAENQTESHHAKHSPQQIEHETASSFMIRGDSLPFRRWPRLAKRSALYVILASSDAAKAMNKALQRLTT